MSIILFTNSENIKGMFPDTKFEDISAIKEYLQSVRKEMKYTNTLTGESLNIWDRIVFAVKEDDRVTGILCLAFLESGFQFNNAHQYACTFVSVHNDYKGRGIASALIDSMFHFAANNDIKLIKQSGYDVDFIKKTFTRCAAKYKIVELVER